jgi:hypothetical protein
MADYSQESYIFDANCFIEPWNKFYSYSFFGDYWDKFIHTNCKDEKILIQREIYDEIVKKDDALSKWIKKHDFLIVETDLALTREVAKINNQFPKLTKETKGRSLADPFIIAIAKLRNATVVTMENDGSESKPKIPYVCTELKVKHINLYQFLERSKVEFSLK